MALMRGRLRSLKELLIVMSFDTDDHWRQQAKQARNQLIPIFCGLKSLLVVRVVVDGDASFIDCEAEEFAQIRKQLKAPVAKANAIARLKWVDRLQKKILRPCDMRG